jgi:hypothetical protein
MSYTKPIPEGLIPTIDEQTMFKGKCQALRTAPFPKPPKSPKETELAKSKARIAENRRVEIPKGYKYTWDPLSIEGLGPACSNTEIKGKTPGPDEITQEIISKTFQAIPNVLIEIRSSLIDEDYDSKGWRQATGAILQKVGELDYLIPKAYRVISLLNCLGKVSERILAGRLCSLAESGPLLHDSQMRGREKMSAVGTALLLTEFIENAN